MTGTNYITSQAQLALQAYLQTLTFADIPTGQIYAGLAAPADANYAESRIVPCIECICQNAEAVDTPNSGNWRASCEVRVLSNAFDTTPDVHHSVSGAVFNSILRSDIETQINAVADDFTVTAFYVRSQGWELDGDKWVSKFNFELICSGLEIDMT